MTPTNVFPDMTGTPTSALATSTHVTAYLVANVHLAALLLANILVDCECVHSPHRGWQSAASP